MPTRSLFFALLFVLLLLAGCGDNNLSNNPPGDQPPPGGPRAPGTPPPGGSAGLPGTFAVSLIASGAVAGELTLNENDTDTGQGRVRLEGAAASATYVLLFCPSHVAGGGDCFDVATFTADGTGAIAAPFQFPRKGVFSGEFELRRDGTREFTSGAYLADARLRAPFQRASLVASNPGFGSNPLAGGTVSVSGGAADVTGAFDSVKIEVRGAAANKTYVVSSSTNLGGSDSHALFPEPELVTDAQGAGKVQGALENGDTQFIIGDRTGDTCCIQFVSGFSVR